MTHCFPRAFYDKSRPSELLQQQLKELQSELAQTRKKTERVEAKVAEIFLHW